MLHFLKIYFILSVTLSNFNIGSLNVFTGRVPPVNILKHVKKGEEINYIYNKKFQFNFRIYFIFRDSFFH